MTADPSTEKPKALLIEDDHVFRQIVMISLAKRGYDVVEAVSFEEGREVIENVSLSFVMTGIFMEGMVGIAGIQVFKGKFPNLPVIAISGGWAGLDPDDAIAAAQKIDADAGVKKSISAIDFDATLKQIGRGAPVNSF
jgi:DNA-binding NtrC family response regulator